MNFSVNSVNFVRTARQQDYKSTGQHNITFSGNKNENQTAKKAMPWFMSALMLLGGISCSDNQKYSEKDYYDGIEVEFSNVGKITKDSVMKPVYDMKQKLSSENDFLDGTKFDIADDFSKIDHNDDLFKKYLRENKSKFNKGTSFYSDKNLRNRVALQEISHSKSYPEMRQTLMHEVGHQFDNYFGHNHNSDFAQKWDSLVFSKDMPYDFATITKYDQSLDIEYNYNNSLSDKLEFQNALLNDLKHIKRIKRRHDIMPNNLDYFIGRFDLYGEITPEDVDGENAARAEIYAQLFSYATGQDDGEKEQFLNCFPNCYEVVQNDIEKFLNIQKCD